MHNPKQGQTTPIGDDSPGAGARICNAASTTCHALLTLYTGRDELELCAAPSISKSLKERDLPRAAGHAVCKPYPPQSEGERLPKRGVWLDAPECIARRRL